MRRRTPTRSSGAGLLTATSSAEHYRTEKAQWEVEKKEAREANEPLPDPPEEPVMGRTLVHDATVEALVVRLEENPRGLLCAQDELSGWVKGMDQYKSGGKGSERQQWLSMWSGDPVYVDRKGRKEPHVVPRPLVCLSGSIQPSILPELGKDREDGLLDRFLLAYPDRKPSRWSDDVIAEETVEAYHKLYRALYGLGVDLDENGDPNPRRLRFTERAREVFKRKSNFLQEETEHPMFPTHLRGPWLKLEAYIARLSLILVLVRTAQQEQGSPEHFMAVSEQDVEAAAELISYFKAHALRAHAKLHGERPEYLLLLALDRFLQEEGGRWEGMTSELYEILKTRAAPGLPGGHVPLGKTVRKYAEVGVLEVDESWRGRQPIIKLTRSAPGALDYAAIPEVPAAAADGDSKTDYAECTDTTETNPRPAKVETADMSSEETAQEHEPGPDDLLQEAGDDDSAKPDDDRLAEAQEGLDVTEAPEPTPEESVSGPEDADDESDIEPPEEDLVPGDLGVVDGAEAADSYAEGVPQALETAQTEPVADFNVVEVNPEDEQFDEDRISKIVDFLRGHREYLYKGARELIDDGDFHELDIDPTPSEVEEAQGILLNE